MIKQLATTPIWKISMPAVIHCDMSGLDALASIIFRNKAVLNALNTIGDLQNPLDRIGLLICCIVDPHTVFFSDKPFNPILGEFLRYKAGEYEIKVEQVSHHPPICAVQVQGPNFTMYAPRGVRIDGFNTVRPGIFNLDVMFDGQTIRLETRSGLVLEWENIGYRVGNYVSRSRKVAYYGPLKITDLNSGFRFMGDVDTDSTITGTIYDGSGNEIHTVAGSTSKGLLIDGKRWTDALGKHALQLETMEEDKDEPLFTPNVWQKVFEQLRKSPPDYDAAEAEKCKVEDLQREKAKSQVIYTQRLNLLPNLVPE